MSDPTHDWLQRARAEGWDGPLLALLDWAAPLGPLGAQALLVLQPALGVFVAPDVVRQAVQLLESPEALAKARAALERDPA